MQVVHAKGTLGGGTAAAFCVTPPPPSQNRIFRPAKRIDGATGRETHFIRRSAEARAYEEELRWRLPRQPLFKAGTELFLCGVWGTAGRVRTDFDNPLKLLCDALQGVYYQNDNALRGGAPLAGKFKKDGEHPEWNKAALVLICEWRAAPAAFTLAHACALSKESTFCEAARRVLQELAPSIVHLVELEQHASFPWGDLDASRVLGHGSRVPACI